MGYINIQDETQVASFSPAAGYRAEMHVFASGSERALPLYSDADLTTSRSNPVLADETGTFDLCYLFESQCRIIVKTPEGVVLTDQDNVVPSPGLYDTAPPSFSNHDALISDTTLSYSEGSSKILTQEDVFLETISNGRQLYQIASETATDYDFETAGGLKLYAVADQGGRLNVLSFGVDNTGETACDDTMAAAIEAAKSRDLGLYIPAGYYRVERGIDFIASDTINGYAINMDVEGAGINSTVFFSQGSPEYVLRINARYISFSGFSVWGSRDQIRDSQHSAPIGIWMENMREGRLSDFKVQHIVGAGLQIDKCIVSRIDGIVYRCGSDEKRAIEQTDEDTDGCQASWVRLNVEDAHGALGGMRWVSHRNTHIDVKMENQPYHILEIEEQTGRPIRDDVLTFTSGATGVIALTSNNPDSSYNNRMQLVVKDVEGTFAVGDSYTSSAGLVGTVMAWTAPTGPQFETLGTYGFLSLYINQNKLKPTGASIIITGSENEFSLVKLRGHHEDIGMEVTGNDNTFAVVDLHQALESYDDHASYGYSLSVSGYGNHFNKVETRNSKGILLSGQATVVDALIQRQLYGQGAKFAGLGSGAKYVEAWHATYTDTNGDLDNRIFHLSGENTFLGTDGGRIVASASGQDVVRISGESARLGPVDIQGMGTSSNAVNMTGLYAKCQGGKLQLSDGTTGILASGQACIAENMTILGGAIGVSATGKFAKIKGSYISGYSQCGVSAQPGSSTIGVVVDGVSFTSPDAAANQDILVGSNLDYSHIVNNSIYDGVGVITLPTGTGNVSTGNI